ncbi:MAG: glucose-6-phosphate isomerase [Cyclobacteriaceae bacterium]
MLPKIDPTTTRSWEKLLLLSQESKSTISELFLQDSERLSKFTRDLESIHFDFSKNNVSEEVLNALNELAIECKLPDAIEAMFKGDKINETENRSVLHTELRSADTNSKHSDIITAELRKIEVFSKKIIEGDWKGYTGKKITDVVNVGIGGSDLGPKMITNTLQPYWKSVTPHFVSNVDAQQLVEELEGLNPETTLFIIASKTFTTQETMTNAMSAREWFLKNGGALKNVSNHFVAVSTNEEAVLDFGINSENMFMFWDWVGGRYSLWSAIGLIIACTVGYSRFEELLRGAERMDDHFRTSSISDNIPAMSALIGIWYNNFLNYDSYAILPYDHRLRFLPSYLQQADMESNGKSTDRNGQPVSYATGPVIWGEPGTNGQHAFYQLIHQGTRIIPCDFIASAKPGHDYADHHNKLLANFLAQPEALMKGRTLKEVEQELKDKTKEEAEALAPFKVFEGNRPSTSILMDELTPFNLGMLTAFYEHRIFVQGVIWNIFSFDQWGVELGKQLAKPILSEIQNNLSGDHDQSTHNLLNKIQGIRR